MTSLTMKPGGELTLPPDLCERYGLTADVPIRVIETQSGFLLIPLTTAAMDPHLAEELTAWQELSAASWSKFPF